MAALTQAKAREIVEKIEGLQAQIAALYREADTFAGQGNSNVIRDILKERAARAEADYNAEALLESFDVVE